MPGQAGHDVEGPGIPPHFSPINPLQTKMSSIPALMRNNELERGSQCQENRVQFPLGFITEGNLLQASVSQTMVVESTGQEVIEYDFEHDNTFNTDWE